MRTRPTRIVPAVTLLIAALAGGRFAALTPPVPETPAEIQALLNARIGDHPGAGLVVGLIDGSGRRTIVTAGRAGERLSRPLDGRTVFEIGSVSKVFTAAILMDMARRGDVNLDDPVAKFLPPGVHLPERDGRAITLRSLVTHTSGLPRMPTNFVPKNPDNPYVDFTAPQLYEFLGQYQLPRAIGERYEYSNLGMGLLGHALSLKAGSSYEALLLDRIARPLKLKDTRIVLSPDMSARLAAGHDERGNPAGNWDIPTLAGAGAIRSTADDLLTFLAANLPSARGALSETLASTHGALYKTGDASMQVAMGWHLRSNGGVTVTWHNGGTGGYHSFIGFNPAAGTAVVVLFNAAASIDDIGFHLLDPGFAVAPAKPLPKPRPEVAVRPEALEGYVGRYALSPAFAIDVTREGDRLFIQATNQPRFPVFAESETRFFLKVVDAQITFVKGADGTVTELVLHQNGIDQRGKRQ